MAATRKTPYAWEVQWEARHGGYVPSINVVAWNENAALKMAENILPGYGRPTKARNLDTPVAKTR